jgi:hypothetical protein
MFVFCHLSDLDVDIPRSPNWLSKLRWYFYRRWSLHDGEEHTRGWHQLHFILTINFGVLLIIGML